MLMQSSDSLAGTHWTYKSVPSLLQLSSSAVLAHSHRHLAVEDAITMLGFSQQKQTASDCVNKTDCMFVDDMQQLRWNGRRLVIKHMPLAHSTRLSALVCRSEPLCLSCHHQHMTFCYGVTYHYAWHTTQHVACSGQNACMYVHVYISVYIHACMCQNRTSYRDLLRTVHTWP